MKDEVLPEAEVLRRLARLPGWTLAEGGKALRRELSMDGFASAAELLSRVAKEADAMDHHPDVHLTGYRRLAFELSTHSAGGVTEKDFALARKIEALPKALRSPA